MQIYGSRVIGPWLVLFTAVGGTWSRLHHVRYIELQMSWAADLRRDSKHLFFTNKNEATVLYSIHMTVENTDKCSNSIAALEKCKSVNQKTDDAIMGSYFFVSIARANIFFR